MNDERRTSRRRFLRTGAATIALATVAGCSALPFGDGSDGGDGNGGDGNGGDGNGGDGNGGDGNGGDGNGGDGNGGGTDEGGENDLRSIAVGETREGNLDRDDGNDPEYGDLAEPVTFEGQADQGVRIAMSSEEFDTYLLVTGPDGDLIGQNDDAGASTDSEVKLVLPTSGTYTIWAGSWSGDATGSYTLTVEEGDFVTDGADLRSIAYGETREGFVDFGDGRDPTYGDLAEPVEFEGSGGDSVRIEMQSGDFDTYLLLTGPDGETVAENDDGPSGTDSLITTTLPSSGTYTIWAGSLSGSATGSYTLTLERN